MSEINELKEQLAEMQQRINELEQDQMEQPVQRRNMLKAVAGVAAGAAVGGLGFARSAAAADGDNIAIGDETNIADSATLLVSNDPFTLGGQGGIFGVTDNGLNGAAKLFDALRASRMISQQMSARRWLIQLSRVAQRKKTSTLVLRASETAVYTYGVTDGIEGLWWCIRWRISGWVSRSRCATKR